MSTMGKQYSGFHSLPKQPNIVNICINIGQKRDNMPKKNKKWAILFFFYHKQEGSLAYTNRKKWNIGEQWKYGIKCA